MTITQTLNPVESGGLAVMKEMKIKANSLSFKILAEKLYQDPLSAVFREMGQNCADAHLKAGNPDPFTIEFPTISNPYLSFIDNGTGMDPAFIEDNENGYLSAFDSTKRTENNSSGGFGIGRISFFSLCDQYSLINRWNGVISTYQLFFNEKGIPTLAKISEAPTDLGNGVTITGAVPLKLISDCHNKARAIFQWYDVLPNFLYYNGPKITKYNLETEYKKENNWYITNLNRCYVWMGTYAYEFDAAAFGDRLTEQQRLLLKCGVVIKANVGDVSVNVSREAINYDEAACAYLIRRLNDIIIDLAPILQSELGGGKTKYHATSRYKKYDYNFKALIKTYSSILNRATLAKLDDTVTHIYFDPSGFDDKNGVVYTNNSRYYKTFTTVGQVYKAAHHNQEFINELLSDFGITLKPDGQKLVTFVPNSVIIINDNKSIKYINSRDNSLLEAYFNKYPEITSTSGYKKDEHVYYVSVKLAAVLKEFFVKLNVDDLFTFINCSEFFTPPVAAVKQVKDVAGFVSVLKYGHAQAASNWNAPMYYYKPERQNILYGTKYYYLHPKQLARFQRKSPLFGHHISEPLMVTRLLKFICPANTYDGSPIILMSKNSSNHKFHKINSHLGTDILPILRNIANSRELLEGLNLYELQSTTHINLHLLIQSAEIKKIPFSLAKPLQSFYTHYSSFKSNLDEIRELARVTTKVNKSNKHLDRVNKYIETKNPLIIMIKDLVIKNLSSGELAQIVTNL